MATSVVTDILDRALPGAARKFSPLLSALQPALKKAAA
jgi:hypothetical protein